MGTKLSTHVVANLKWYIYKYRTRRTERQWYRHTVLGGKPEAYYEDHYSHQDLEVLQRRIEQMIPCAQTRWLITTVNAQELSLEKCAEHLGWSVKDTFAAYRDAMILLKNNLSE